MYEAGLVAFPQEQAAREEMPLWQASWVNPHGRMEWIHRYIFAAPTLKAAQQKLDAWMRKRPCPLPSQARMRPRRLVLREPPEYPLDFWQITWPENDELHTLILFEAGGQRTASRKAMEWARTRCESREQLQLLRRLTDAERAQARFDPNEGIEMSVLL